MILRIANVFIRSSTKIEVYFTNNLDEGISVENVSIEVPNYTTSSLEVISVVLSNKIMTITTKPMVSGGYYKLIFSSTTNQNFISSRGEKLIEDGKNNVHYFVGINENNEIKNRILDNLPDIYTTDSGSLINDVIGAGAEELLMLSNCIKEVKSENYVSVEVVDEELVRGSGPFDRLSNEGAFQLIRVGSLKTNSSENDTIEFDIFPSSVVSLQQVLETEIVSNSSDQGNSFSGLVISLAKKPVIKVSRIILKRNGINYEYDIEKYKYGLLESKYDVDFSFSYASLSSDQVLLNNSAIGVFPYPQGSDTITVEYLYKKTGRDVSDVAIYTTTDKVRENVEAVATSFFLDNAPIIDISGNIPDSGGVVWLDPSQNYDETLKHPAFITEIAFTQSSLPKSPGEFSINYTTGQVFVFGVDGSGTDGTTITPPVATYKFKKTYIDGLDYLFYSDLDEVVSIPDRDLRDNPGTISFKYEDTFANGVDFIFNAHSEELNERVENRLIEGVGLRTKNYPVNQVFRIYNETTGEIYTPARVVGNEIYFTSVNPPRTKNVVREAVDFESIIQSQLVIMETIEVVGKSFSVFKINLEDNNIMSQKGGFIGSSFNTSLSFSDTNTFIQEIYYNTDSTLEENLLRLYLVGDYVVDYENGVIYLATDETSADLGDASYKRGRIKTNNSKIIRADNVYRSSSVNEDNVETFVVGEVDVSTIIISGLSHAGEKEIVGNVIVVDGGKAEVSQGVFRLNGIYQVTDLQTTYNPINFGVGAVSTSTSSAQLVLAPVEIQDTNDESGIPILSAGSRKYIEAVRLSELFNEGLAVLNSVISVSPIDGSENLYLQGIDGYLDASENRIYLPTSVSYSGLVKSTYTASLRDGAAVLVDYVSGDVFVDYTYSQDELIVSYEYGDNVLDWSVSSSLSEGDIYYASYKYGALRNSLRDNFGVLTSIPDLSTIPDQLDRETYRNAISGTLQAFVGGPTIPSIENLVKAFTKISPEITESVFLEWILGRDNLSLTPMRLAESFNGNLPAFADGKFGKGLLLNESGQSAVIPAESNIRVGEGTWESFVIPNWDGIDNDASLTFDLQFEGSDNIQKVFIGSGATNPTEIPFTLTKDDLYAWGIPYNLHGTGVSGYFVWYDSTFKKWRVRMRAPILEERSFTGEITTSGQFYEALVATTADGYDGYYTQYINELNDKLWTTDEKIKFDFIVDGYDILNIGFDSYDSYGVGVYAGFDGIDFSSDNFHYFYDMGTSLNKNRMSLFKDGRGSLKFRVFDNDGRKREISKNISTWLSGEVHHLATSWRINSIEQNDELHLFVDGEEASNNYRFNGYLSQSDGHFLDTAYELLLNSASKNTIGGKDLSTASGSNIVSSSLADFSTISIGDQFIIIDDTIDGARTLTSPYVYVKSIIGLNQLELETGLGADFNLSLPLTNVGFSINPLTLKTLIDPNYEKIRVFAKDLSDVETELNSPSSINPEYDIYSDGYNDYIKVYNGVAVGDDVILKTYGLNLGRCTQDVYVWGDDLKNTLSAILPQPTNVSKINITGLIIKNTKIEEGLFSLISTVVGGHLINLLVSSLDFCQVSNSITGRKISVTIGGNNFYWAGVNQVMFIGETTDSINTETITFTNVGKQTTTKNFTRLDDVIVTFTPINPLRAAGSIEVREAYPINWEDNDGYCATVRLSVVEQAGFNGEILDNTEIFSDEYSRFGAEDVGKNIQIISPASIAGIYSIEEVNLDPSLTLMDSNTITLDSVFSDGYSNVYWKLLNTSFADSGFSNGLITLENDIGEPFLLKGCWFEIDMPVKLYIPWSDTPKNLFIGSDMMSLCQSNAVIDEMRILNELSSDSALGQIVSSSERTITTDYLKVNEFETNDQTLALFHFNDDVVNSAKFNLNYSATYIQSQNSVNSNFGQSGVFISNISTKFDNASIFRNNQGTIEFWVSPLLDTYNDPKKRYYVDLSTELVTEVIPTTLITIVLSFRVSSISSIKISGDDTNYFIGGTLSSDGVTITLGQHLPSANVSVLVTYVPIISQGDRFSIYKSENQQIVLAVRASGVDYTIHAPVYWKKGTWHRIFVGWDLNNSDNQDRLILMVDGLEAGTIRYGTGLIYGTGNAYGQQTVWGNAEVGTTASRNILDDINLLDTFNEINVGSDFSGAHSAYAKFDNMRFSSDLRSVVYLGGSGPGQLIGRDILYTSNLNSAIPVTTDALTRLLLDFNSASEFVENITTIRDASSGIFDFYVKVIDSFSLIDSDLAKKIVISLINQLKPAHTRAFVSFIK